MIGNYWPAWFMDLIGGDWPDNYCAFDLETTGFHMGNDVVTEWGHCLVQDRKPTDRLSLIIDWTGHKVVPDHWLRNRLIEVRRSLESQGGSYHITYERMEREGVKPEKALPFILEYLKTLAANDTVFVAHGGYTFDEKMLVRMFSGFIGVNDFSFGDNNLIDTDGVEKASQCLYDPKMHPRKGDTLRSYFHRVKYAKAPGVKSNLSTHCFDKYKFAEKYGLKRKDMHGARDDSYCCHVLMEEFRAMRAAVEPIAFRADRAMPMPRHDAYPPSFGNSRSQPLTPPPPAGIRRRGQRNN